MTRCLVDDDNFISKNNLYASGAFQQANYFNDKCKLLESPHASAIIRLKTATAKKEYPRISFVGDSLGRQLYVSLLCDLEHYGIGQDFLVHYVIDMTLRVKHLCHERCVSEGPKFEQSPWEIFSACTDCPDGVRSNETDDITSLKHWRTRIPNDTDVLIANTGAWYKDHFFADPNAAYEETIRAFAEAAKPLLARGVIVVWTALPPAYANDNATFSQATWETRGWHRFQHYNEYAERILSPLGVIVVNPSEAAIKRMHHDKDIFYDGMHYRAPAAHSMPHFIMRCILHLVAKRMIEKSGKYLNGQNVAETMASSTPATQVDTKGRHLRQERRRLQKTKHWLNPWIPESIAILEEILSGNVSKLNPSIHHSTTVLARSAVVSSYNPFENPQSTSKYHYLLSEGYLSELPSKYVAQCLIWFGSVQYLNLSQEELAETPRNSPMKLLCS
jgi:hypothetical protein